MVKIKFKKRVVPKRQIRPMILLGGHITNRKPMPRIGGHSKLRFADSISIPKPTSVSLFSPSMNRPAAAFWGDYDGDGVYNGLDCQPRNKYKQGPQHKKTGGKKIYSGFSSKGKRLPAIDDPSTWPDMGGPMDYDFDEDEKLSAEEVKKKQFEYNQASWKAAAEEEEEKAEKKLQRENKNT